MPFSDEFCSIHGYTLRFDRNSGFDVCDQCEEGKCPECLFVEDHKMDCSRNPDRPLTLLVK